MKLFTNFLPSDSLSVMKFSFLPLIILTYEIVAIVFRIDSFKFTVMQNFQFNTDKFIKTEMLNEGYFT
jgi:hypothetical protein